MTITSLRRTRFEDEDGEDGEDDRLGGDSDPLRDGVDEYILALPASVRVDVHACAIGQDDPDDEPHDE